jgi:hypothetical protein
MLQASTDQTAPTETPPPAPADRSIEEALRKKTLALLNQEEDQEATKLPELKAVVGLYFKARQLDLAERKFQIQVERHRATLAVIQEKLGLAPRASGEVTEEESRAILGKLDEILGLNCALSPAANAANLSAKQT